MELNVRLKGAGIQNKHYTNCQWTLKYVQTKKRIKFIRFFCLIKILKFLNTTPYTN